MLDKYQVLEADTRRLSDTGKVSVLDMYQILGRYQVSKLLKEKTKQPVCAFIHDNSLLGNDDNYVR